MRCGEGSNQIRAATETIVSFHVQSPDPIFVITHPQDRSIPVREMTQKLGGQLIGFYFCYGEYDVVGLVEMPDDNTATAFALAAMNPGHLKAFKTTKLFTVEETMEAMRKAGSVALQAPSRK